MTSEGDPVNIPEEIVEKAAEALHQYTWPGADWCGNLAVEEREIYRAKARAALSAAAPYLMAREVVSTIADVDALPIGCVVLETKNSTGGNAPRMRWATATQM